MLNKQVDYKLFFSVFSLIIFGMIMISSVSVYSSFRVTSLLEKTGSIKEAYNYFYVIRNITHVVISMIMLLFLVKIPFHFFEKHAKHIFIGNLILMFYVLFFGQTLNGATGWINIPGLPSLQPVEFLKFSLIIFLSYYFKKHKEKIPTFNDGFIPFSGLLALIVIILGLQPDFGSIMLIGPIMVMMFFISGAKVKHLGYFLGIGILLFTFVYTFGKYDKTHPETKNKLSYITDRIDNFITDEKEQIKNKTINYQTEQGLIAIGSGGFTGLGFGNSIQKFGYLPEVQGDFVFSVIIEELGFIGGLVLLGFYAFIGYRGYLISFFSQDLFAKYASFGITTRILIQACINIGVNLNIVPLTGLTLPFVSYGGSSLISLVLGLGLLLNISRYIDETKGGKIYNRSSSSFSHERVNMY
ncbi:MAG: putative peptidoglycan glycosyltransferase FtsW [Candidatus Gracilibacteria bacterium]|nr:putative peptidoglycan glycosyltransferase FtsW [Candidatus Gracilibacteria bacterium]